MKTSFSIAVGLVLALFVAGPTLCSQTQTISAELATQDGWSSGGTISGIKMTSSGMPGATLTFEVTVSAPGGTYQVSLPIVKAYDAAHIAIYLDGKLQAEADTFSESNVEDSILVTKAYIAPGEHTIKVKNLGQKKAHGGNYLYVKELQIVGEDGSGKWEVAKKGFVFTPADVASASGAGRFLEVGLPARAQKAAFSVPEGSVGGDIFAHPMVSVKSIPFRIPKVGAVPETGLADQVPLEVTISKATGEVFLLIWSNMPLVDADAGPSLPPFAPVDQSERFAMKLTYADGASEETIPFDVGKKRYGLDNGIALYVIHPDAKKVLKSLSFEDRTYKSSFGLVALTCNLGKPVLPESPLGGRDEWYAAVNRTMGPQPKAPKVISTANNRAVLSDGTVAARLDTRNGLRWESLGAPFQNATGQPAIDSSALFSVRPGDAWIGSDAWKVTDAKTSKDGVSVVLEYKENNVDLKGAVTLTLAGNGKMKAGLTLTNQGTEPFLGRVKFPILEGVKLGSVEDTWYLIPSAGRGMIGRDEVSVYGSHGAEHPLQVDSFFNPRQWYALTLLSNDLEGQFHWYDVGKDEKGGWYRLEYLEKSLKPGGAWTLPTSIIAVTPGDWQESFRLYRQWVAGWYKPKPAASEWYRKSFIQGFWYNYMNRDFATDAQQIRDIFGYCDGLNAYFWNAYRGYPKTTANYSGEYDRTALWPGFGGEEGLKASVKKGGAAGVPVSFYTDAILINDMALHNGVPTKKAEWIGAGDCMDGPWPAYRPCLFVEEWLKYMVDCETWLTRDIGAKIIYLDEFGYGGRVCYSKTHGHDSPYPDLNGEKELTRRIRAAVPEDVAICSENVPEDTRFALQDGYYTGALSSSKPAYYVPVDLVRFAFPETKAFNLMYGYSLKDGNWELLKFILFNGSSYGMSRSYDPKSYFEERSIEVLRKLFRILHENADAFTSRDATPLIPTRIPGVFVNRFRGKDKTIWTVYNANYRTARGRLIEIAPKPGSKYVDLWNGFPVQAKTAGKVTSLYVEIGPRDIACVSEVPR